ncbi:hypothetical protein ATN89_01455 [Comamonas thiooxydans]|nr:hypothetical protein ATN89_01455 [Comamonas thiooxydans]
MIALNLNTKLQWSLSHQFRGMALKEKDRYSMMIQSVVTLSSPQKSIGCKQVGLSIVRAAKASNPCNNSSLVTLCLLR